MSQGKQIYLHTNSRIDIILHNLDSLFHIPVEYAIISTWYSYQM